VHRLQAHIDLHPDHVVLALDFRNGFNSLRRDRMLEALYAQPSLSILWRLADWCYGSPSELSFVSSPWLLTLA
jgi:hypothetical protein